MTATSGKALKKEKVKRQTPEERLEALRYNQMMYGPTSGEMKPPPKKINYGASYLNHPKFQNLMTAFKKGADFKFDVTDKGKTHTISTNDYHIYFDNKVIYYCRPSNRHEDNLLLDGTSTIQYQSNEPLIHLAIAVLRYFQELGTPLLSYANNQFYFGNEPLELSIADKGPNLLIGAYRHNKVQEKTKK